MKRAATKRPPASIENGISARPSAPAVEPAATPAASAGETGRLGWGWRLALFLWASSFVFLLVYEMLINLFLKRN